MKVELMNKIANSEISGYYDRSLKKIVVYFHKTNDDNDLVAYLNENMTWDLREISGERSILYDDHEMVKVEHTRLGNHSMGSDLDKSIRSVIKKMVDGLEGDKNSKIIKAVLDKNSYKGIV